MAFFGSGWDDWENYEVLEERTRCSKILDVSDDDIRLMAGELSAQEMRTVKAVLKALKTKIDNPR